MKFDVIYADPPWQYECRKFGNKPTLPYSTLPLQEICDLDIRSISEKNSVCFLWVTVLMLEEGLLVLKAWGYKYKTMLTWHKTMSFGLGCYFRGQTEHILAGIKGNIKAFRCQRENFIQAKVLTHSEKPEQFRKLIELATPNLTKKLEIFSRKKVPNWYSIGYDIDNKDIKESIEILKNSQDIKINNTRLSMFF